MVWGGISYEADTDLVVLNRGSVTAQIYVEEVTRRQHNFRTIYW